VLVHALEVVHARLDEVAVGDRDLLSRQGADARGLDADLLDSAALIAKHDEVANLERTVEDDGERGEEIAQHALGGECNGDAPDAQAGDQSGYVEAEVLEDEQKRKRPDRNTYDELDQRQRIAGRGSALQRRKTPGEDRRGDAIGPNGRLDEESDDENRRDPAVDDIRQAEERRADVEGRDDQEECPGAGDEFVQHLGPVNLFSGLGRGKAARQEEPHQEAHDQRGYAQGGGNGPLGQAVAVDLALQKLGDGVDAVHAARLSLPAR